MIKQMLLWVFSIDSSLSRKCSEEAPKLVTGLKAHYVKRLRMLGQFTLEKRWPYFSLQFPEEGEQRAVRGSTPGNQRQEGTAQSCARAESEWALGNLHLEGGQTLEGAA